MSNDFEKSSYNLPVIRTMTPTQQLYLFFFGFYSVNEYKSKKNNQTTIFKMYDFFIAADNIVLLFNYYVLMYL